ncbi:MAG: M20/M25/M40 family metallo-hydrolase [Planctomycetota bacterium]
MIDQIRRMTRDGAFQQRLTDLLVDICQVDSTPRGDVAVMRQAEDEIFGQIKGYLGELSFSGGTVEQRPVDPRIASHPAYSRPHFTKTPDRPEGLPPEETYRDRSNLLFRLPGINTSPAGRNTAVHSHVDVVAPFIAPELKQGVVHGRGACDDKGNVAVILGALGVLARLVGDSGLNKDLTAMFVVEEETGGNGSLSLAVDQSLNAHYDSIMVLECAGNRVYPANRGAVWYQLELRCQDLPQLELAAFVIMEMELEGRAIKAESRHPLFPQRPVQTCHGMIGPYGEHPSRICGDVGFAISFERTPAWEQVEPLVNDCIASGLDMYTRIYGDKTKISDPSTGQPKVKCHFDMEREENACVVNVHGSTGHMGAIDENDGAITKMAFLVRALAYSRGKLEEAAGTPLTLTLADPGDSRNLRLEGGQGFIPNHGIDEIMERIRSAAQRGAANYLCYAGRQGGGAESVRVTYEKLHNDAFDGDPNSPSMRNAIYASRAAGRWQGGPVSGWTVSCDARLFAGERPGMPVLTAGVGELAHAHSDDEQLALDQLWPAVEFLAAYLLLETGTCSPEQLVP